jgi:hypothetical protein
MKGEINGGMNGSRRTRRIPVAPLLLGGAGLLPPVLAIFLRLAAGADAPLSGVTLRLAILYAMLILSFLGGIWWGAGAAKAPAERQPAIFVLAVAPSLVALLLFALTAPLPLVATILLGVVIAASPLADAWLCSMELMPAWWMRLRVTLSLLLGGLVLALAGLLAMPSSS